MANDILISSAGAGQFQSIKWHRLLCFEIGFRVAKTHLAICSTLNAKPFS